MDCPPPLLGPAVPLGMSESSRNSRQKNENYIKKKVTYVAIVAVRTSQDGRRRATFMAWENILDITELDFAPIMSAADGVYMRLNLLKIT